MSDAITHLAREAIRASDGERDQVVAQLQRHFADGRLSHAELEERVGAALVTRTRDQLQALTADLPGPVVPTRRATVLEPWLLCLLLVVCPPAGLTYWLLSRRGGTGGGFLLKRQLAGIPNWAWILIIAVAVSAAAHR